MSGVFCGLVRVSGKRVKPKKEGQIVICNVLVFPLVYLLSQTSLSSVLALHFQTLVCLLNSVSCTPKPDSLQLQSAMCVSAQHPLCLWAKVFASAYCSWVTMILCVWELDASKFTFVHFSEVWTHTFFLICGLMSHISVLAHRDEILTGSAWPSTHPNEALVQL